MTTQEVIAALEAELKAIKNANHLKKYPRKVKKSNGVSYLPPGMTGRSLAPISGDQVKDLKIKNLRALARDCRTQSDLYITKAEIVENQANEMEGVPQNNEVHARIEHYLNYIREYCSDNQLTTGLEELENLHQALGLD